MNSERITETGDSLERERKSVATASSDNDRKARAGLSERSNSGVSEGCGDWSVRITITIVIHRQTAYSANNPYTCC
ncbi:MAG: hypothetical protein OIN83_11315 [Candidatus Methanoperedens sp.]|nr:hypothetical protein [Candidatus Methanoperedens sp.]